jgi:lipopolysaccharide transport system ATP-binding protein
MSNIVVTVNALSKQYRLGLKEKQAETFFGAVRNTLLAPLTNFKQIRDLGRTGRDDESIFWALSDVSFTVKEGDVLAIIGRNGAGKSTLLKILSRITEPTRGEIKLKGRVSSLLEVGTGFHPELTGRENVYMNGTILGMTPRRLIRNLMKLLISVVLKNLLIPLSSFIPQA